MAAKKNAGKTGQARKSTGKKGSAQQSTGKKGAGAIKKTGKLQKGRQQGSGTGREAYKSNSQEFFRHPGQGMRGEQGGQREASRTPGQESVGSDTRKHTRPKSER